QSSKQPDHDNPNDQPPYGPQSLHALKMLDAVPPPVSPRPRAPFRAEHEGHDDRAEERNQGKQRDERVITDAPYPTEQEGAPVPAIDFPRDDSRLVANGRVHHSSSCRVGER